MELEQRVKSLEYEMKILKNEMQKTLLEIQEQILIHYYPDLRMENPAGEAVTQTLEDIRSKKTQLEQESRPAVKQVSLEEARNMRDAPPDSIPG